METSHLRSSELVGSYRRFGSEGPVYHIVEKAGPQQVKIVVIETGEKLDYPIAKAKADPQAN